MTVSFEIAREHREKAPPFSDGCERCVSTEWNGVVIPFATITNGDSLTAFYHHGRCGNQWFTNWSAQYDHTWQRVLGASSVDGGRRLAAVRGVKRPALPAPRESGGRLA